MRTIFLAAVSGAALVTSFAAQAEGAAPPSQRASTEAMAAGDPDRIVCLYLYHNGTVVRRQICHTAHAWLAQYEYGRQEIRNVQMLGLIQKHP